MFCLIPPLSIPHPHVWIETRRKFFLHPIEQRWMPKSNHAKAVAADYESDVFSLLLSHALRILRFDLPHDPDSGDPYPRDPHSDLSEELQCDVTTAASAAGLTIYQGNRNARRTIEGGLASTWIRRASWTVAGLALDYYDDAEAQRRHDLAVLRGRKGKRQPVFKLEDTQLPPTPSVPAIMEAMGCCRSTAQRLRRRALAEAD